MLTWSRRAAKSTGGAKGKGKITPYNKFMKEELARLKDSHPDLKHPERLVSETFVSRMCTKQSLLHRFKIAAGNWGKAKENPKNAK